MFGTYSVPGTDIVFACIMCALAMVLAYMIGRINNLQEVDNQLRRATGIQLYNIKQIAQLEADLRSVYTDWSNDLDTNSDHWQKELKRQRVEITKKHRLAMAKYKAKCDAKLVLYIKRVYDTGLAELRSQDDLK